MKRFIHLSLLLTIILAFTGCDEESPYSGYAVNFSFDKSIHPYNQVNSYGQFICVRRGANVGEYKLTDTLGKTQTVNIPQIQIQQGTFHYGCGGLIIGTPMNCDGAIWAYDWACPKCDNSRHRINLDYTFGHAICPNCATKFDLNSGGIPIDGDSRPLWRYRVFDLGSNVLIQN